MTLKLTEQLISDMRTLNNLFFFDKDESFVSDFNSNALKISQATDIKIQEQIDRIEQRLNETSAALANENQTGPLNQEIMNERTVAIMEEYLAISGSITLRSESKGSRDYTVGLNRIQTALKNFARAIDTYNETAVSKNWPMIQSLFESQSIAKQRFDSSRAELLNYLEEKDD